MTRINASGALERAVPLLTLHRSESRWPSSHGCAAPGAVDEVKPAQGQDVPGGQPGGVDSIDWFSGNHRPTGDRHCGLHRLRPAPEKIPITSRLNLKPVKQW